MKDNDKKKQWGKNLSKLKTHLTRPSLDDRMKQAIDRLEWRTKLEKSLPTHTAPERWEDIDKGIYPKQPLLSPKKLKWMALFIILISTLVLYLYLLDFADEKQTDTHEHLNEEVDMAWDSKQWLYFDEFCEEHFISCDILNMDSLHTEWDETVKNLFDLKESIIEYGKEELLLHELNRLEAEYTELVTRFLNTLLS